MNTLRNFRIGTRLAVGFGLLLAMLLGISALSLQRMSGLNASLSDIVRTSNEQVRQSNTMRAAISRTTTAGRDLILAGAILSILLNPVLFALVDRFASEPAAAAKPKPGPGPGADPPQDEPAPEATPDLDITPTTLSDHMVVVGYGRVGALLGAGLLARGEKVLVIEEQGDAVATARRDGAELLRGNAADPTVLAAAGLTRAKRLFVAIPQSFEAGQVCEQARRDNPALPIVARAHSDAEVAHLTRCGATLTIMGEAEIARAMLALCGTSETPASVQP